MSIPKVLTIAGSDSGGGAGIEADLKTFTIFKTYGMATITSVTAQNTLGVQGIHDIPVKMVESQIDSVVEDIGVDAAKTGMLSNSSTVKAVSNKIDEYQIKTVVDPVMVAQSGDRLLQEEAINILINDLVPKSYVITPNIPEAEIISNMEIQGIDEMKKAAEKIVELGANNVIVKGGHGKEDKVVDIFYDGEKHRELEGERYESNKHGTGCTFSAAIAANLSKGIDVTKSIQTSEKFINNAIKTGLEIGEGEGPVNHLNWLEIENSVK